MDLIAETKKVIEYHEKAAKTGRDFLAVLQSTGMPKPTMAPVAAQQPLLAVEKNSGSNARGGYGEFQALLLQAINQCPPQYTLYDVERALVEAGTPIERNRLYTGLARLAKKKRISVVKKGAGRNPSVYSK